MSARNFTTVLSLALCIFGLAVRPCRGQSTFLEQDHSFQVLRLESDRPVTTWEEDGVRVFLAEGGALVRQGEMRLSASRMVVRFYRERSAQIGRAVVEVYAEARGQGDRLRVPVHLVEGRRVRTYGALLMQMRSNLSFAWDCPLSPVESAPVSALLENARRLSKDVEEQIWPEVPPAPGVSPASAVTQMLSARSADVFTEENQTTFVYRGDVRGTYGDLEVRADAAVLWYDTRTQEFDIYAEGSVRVRRRQDAEAGPVAGAGQVGELFRLASADRLYINPARNRGMASDAQIRVADPLVPEQMVYVVRGEELYIIDSNTLSVRKTTLTTCEFALPHYRIQADRAQVVRQGASTVLNVWDARLQVGQEPRTLLWVPFVGTDLTQRAYLLEDWAVGSSDKFGTFVQTTWAPLDIVSGSPEWVERWQVFLDYYSDRGPAVGTELEYGFDGPAGMQSEGLVRGYYVNDTGEEDETGRLVPRSDRGRFHLRHRTQLSDAWRMDGEYYWVSDAGFLDEYFEEDFEKDKSPESYLLARYLHNSTYLALLYKEQVNDFISQLEERPSADLQIAGVPLGRLVYDGSVSAGLFDLEPAAALIPRMADPPDLQRFHTEQMLSLPFMLSIFRIDPSVRAIGTWASESRAGPNRFSSSSEQRTGVGAGVTASTTFSRVFGLTSDLFDLNRLRHIVMPFVSIDALAVTGGDSADFVQMDDIDALDDGTIASVGLRQRLQTKRRRGERWESVDWIDARVAYVTRSSDSVDPLLDEDFVRWDLEMKLTERITLHSIDSRIGLDDLPDIVNVGGVLDFRPRWSLGVDYDFISDTSSTLTADLFYSLSDRYQLLFRQQQEFDSRGTGEEETLETAVVIRRLLHKWALDFGFQFEEANNETALVFGFGPIGRGVFMQPRNPGRAF